MLSWGTSVINIDVQNPVRVASTSNTWPYPQQRLLRFYQYPQLSHARPYYVSVWSYQCKNPKGMRFA